MPKKMILAEDNKDFRETVVDYVGNVVQGVEIEQVPNGKLLVERVRNGGYFLVLTDNEMPEMNGLQAIRGIREFDQQVPIYMLSGSDVREQALQLGATGYINKDFKVVFKQLSPVLKQYLG